MATKNPKSLLKHLSYDGAVRTPPWVPDSWVCWKCSITTKIYTDLDNATYLEVMQLCWPLALLELGISGKETAGDFLEAIFGVYYNLTVKVYLFWLMISSLCWNVPAFVFT